MALTQLQQFLVDALKLYPITIKEKMNVCIMIDNEFNENNDENIEDMIAFLVAFYPNLRGEQIVSEAERISGLKRPLP